MVSLEIRAFGRLHRLFKERGWENPFVHKTGGPLTAGELRENLDIPEKDVEVVFVNRTVSPLTTTLQDGDRVAFVPPGYPTIHRFNLGFYDAKRESEGRPEAGGST